MKEFTQNKTPSLGMNRRTFIKRTSTGASILLGIDLVPKSWAIGDWNKNWENCDTWARSLQDQHGDGGQPAELFVEALHPDFTYPGESPHSKGSQTCRQAIEDWFKNWPLSARNTLKTSCCA